jgi:hypothetical protein
LWPLDQVERQIATQTQLGKDSQIGSTLLGVLGQFQNFGGISGEVADSGIELCERNFHGRLTRIRGKAAVCNEQARLQGFLKGNAKGPPRSSRRPFPEQISILASVSKACARVYC